MLEEPFNSDRTHRRLRLRRHGRRAYIRSVYTLPSLATLGNAVCGFASMYVTTFNSSTVGEDPMAQWFFAHQFVAAAYLIFFAMIFDALDGRLARFARHTTDFGGQLDSLADVVSFGAAPAFLALMVFKTQVTVDLPYAITRLIWAIGALYFSCAAIRLARFNVSNEHGEQAHFSFLGLPSPAAGGLVASYILMQQDLRHHGWESLPNLMLHVLPLVVLAGGLLMVSTIRYPHLVNRYLRGKRSVLRLMITLAILLLVIVAHQYTIGVGMLVYVLVGLSGPVMAKFRKPLAPLQPGSAKP